LLGSGLVLLPAALYAADSSRWIQPEADTVIAEWSVDSLKPAAADDSSSPSVRADASQPTSLDETFRLAAQPGGSWRFDSIALHLSSSSANDPAYASQPKSYYEARLLQHQHRFDDAADKLNALTTADTLAFINVRLLLAQIRYQQGNTEAAESLCRSLTLHWSAGLVATCLASVSNHYNPSLVRLMEQTEPATHTQQLRLWINSQIARQYALGGEHRLAWEALESERRESGLEVMTVPDVVLWGQLAADFLNPTERLTLLTPLGQGRYTDDAILLLLGQASQDCDQRCPSRLRADWLEQLDERMTLRAQRNDLSYAGVLAEYFLTIDQQPGTALYWAEQHAALNHDPQARSLLQRARTQASNSGGNS
tara:strand:- start:28293 stop:29396 length:1104 start_codon:yes stop_codon:yes gene_type:complete